MNRPFEIETPAGERIVYVRPVQVADLPADVQARAAGRQVIWAVHDTDGERLALVAERQMAFLLARQNHLSPLSLH
jgi:hypothetical protein